MLNKKINAFTLIELIVVIAIIGILASVIYPSFSNYQKKGRDGKRLADIKNIASALDQYYLDNGSYPTSTQDTLAPFQYGSIKDLNVLVPKYLSKLPNDPLTKNTNLYWTGTQNYLTNNRDGYYNYYYFIVDTSILCYNSINFNTSTYKLINKRFILVYTLETATNTQNTFPCWGGGADNKKYWFLQQ